MSKGLPRPAQPAATLQENTSPPAASIDAAAAQTLLQGNPA